MEAKAEAVGLVEALTGERVEDVAVSDHWVGPRNGKGFWSDGRFWELDYDEMGTIVGSHEVKKEE